ncbi:MAG: hypothetical protein WCS65_15745 [Verrucomicrobiae bacterium]
MEHAIRGMENPVTPESRKTFLRRVVESLKVKLSVKPSNPKDITVEIRGGTDF